MMRKFSKYFLDILNCIIPAREKVIYISTPITSGKRYYDTITKFNRMHRNFIGLNKSLKCKIMKKNIRDSWRLFHSVRKARPKTLIVNPASLEIDDFKGDQRAYMRFWRKVIDVRSSIIVFNKNWEFSLGCVYEYIIGQQKKIKLFDMHWKPITQAIAIAKIQNAIAYIEKRCRLPKTLSLRLSRKLQRSILILEDRKNT